MPVPTPRNPSQSKKQNSNKNTKPQPEENNSKTSNNTNSSKLAPGQSPTSPNNGNSKSNLIVVNPAKPSPVPAPSPRNSNANSKPNRAPNEKPVKPKTDLNNTIQNGGTKPVNPPKPEPSPRLPVAPVVDPLPNNDSKNSVVRPEITPVDVNKVVAPARPVPPIVPVNQKSNSYDQWFYDGIKPNDRELIDKQAQIATSKSCSIM